MASFAYTLQTFPDFRRDPSNTPVIVDTFLDLYYRRFGPENASAEPLTAGNEVGGWRILLPRWIGQSVILDQAIGALAAAFVGAQYQDVSLIDEARNMYLRALQMVQKVLPLPESTTRKDLLATTLVMSSTELFLSNGGSSSQIAHIEGGTRLVDNAFQTMDFEELHIYILNQGLFSAISTRQRYTFSAPSYRPLLRKLYTVPRTSHNDLFFQWTEAILPLPNILYAADSASSASSCSEKPGSVAAILSILDDLTALEHSITAWYERLRSSTPGPWTFPTAQPRSDSVPFPLQFASIEVCALYCLHWSSQLLILEARQSLNSHLLRSQVPDHPSLATFAAKTAEYASLVCRSVQFCAQGRSYASTDNITFPLVTVLSYYMQRGDEDRMRWCMGAFTRISEEQKIGYALEAPPVLGGQTGTHRANAYGDVWENA